MTHEKVQQALMMYKDKIPNDKMLVLKNYLEKASDDKLDSLAFAKTYSSTTTLILSLFLGGLGVDRFYIGDTGLGVCKLLFGWLTFGIWPFIDIFMSYKKTKEKNLQNLIMSL